MGAARLCACCIGVERGSFSRRGADHAGTSPGLGQRVTGRDVSGVDSRVRSTASSLDALILVGFPPLWVLS